MHKSAAFPLFLLSLFSPASLLLFMGNIEAQTPRIIERILQGEETSEYTSVGIVGSQRNGEFCSGTLISSTYVLTAAHCAEYIESDTSGTFRLGDQVYKTDLVTIHSGYNSSTLTNDIALLRLSEPVVDVEPAAIHRGVPQVGDLLFIVGYGATGTATDGSNGDFGTKRVGVTIIDEVTDTMVNWIFDDANEANTASGDSGGPGFLDVGGELFVASITSGGTEPDSILGDFAFSTRVDAYASWINANLVPVGEPDGEEPVEEEPSDDFWSQPFPILQLLINLLTDLLEQWKDAHWDSEGDATSECLAETTTEQDAESPVETQTPTEVTVPVAQSKFRQSPRSKRRSGSETRRPRR